MGGSGVHRWKSTLHWGQRIRKRLGDAYAEALWASHKLINESADLVMYWWDRAAEQLSAKDTVLRRFGLVTTNSITQEFSRRVIKKRMEGKKPISLVMAIPNHPWTKATEEAAQVRIAMTVAEKGDHSGVLRLVTKEADLDTDQPKIEFLERVGKINPDLTVGVDVGKVSGLRAQEGLCSRGVSLHGDGFIVTRQEAEHLGLGQRAGLENHIREYRNGRDITAKPRGVLVIDLLGLSADEVRRRYPEIYQHVKAEVKEKVVVNNDGEKEFVGRNWNNRPSYREQWWIFGEPRRELRPALKGLSRYIATVETMHHRVFQFLDASILPDNKIVVVASADAADLGVLSSRIHVTWALRAGGWLGVGNDPVYVKTKVFDPFPYPSAGELLKAQIRTVAEELDAFRKQRQRAYPSLTLTQIYNVLQKVRVAATLDDDEERIKEQGLIIILKEYHEKLDALVFKAYGWQESLSDEDILLGLVELNHKRATEERRGHVRWLRPDYQIPLFGKDVDKMAAREEGAQVIADLGLAPSRKPSFPTDAVAQTAAVFGALASARGPLEASSIAAQFRKTRKLEETIFNVLESLARLGYVSSKDGKTFEVRRLA
jgi:hypothetical protein